MNDINSKMFDSNKSKGNNILYDFWASYCVPCIHGIPHLKKLFTQFHDKGFEIISISSDTKKENWLAAIGKYQLSDWPQVSINQDVEKTMQGFVNAEDIDQKYSRDGIPHYYLIDKNGKIIGNWLGDSEKDDNQLDNMLKETFG